MISACQSLTWILSRTVVPTIRPLWAERVGASARSPAGDYWAAEPPAAPGCILTLSATGEDVEVSGSSTLSAPNCSVMAASTDDCAINDHDSGGSITAKYLITAGQVSTGQGCNVVDPTSPPSNMQASLMTGVPSQQFVDPYGASSGTTSFTNSCGSSSYLTHNFLTATCRRLRPA